MALTGGCDSDHGSADPEPSNQWTLDGATGTPIVHAAMKEADGTTYLYLNKNIPGDEESQYGVAGRVVLALPTESLGTEYVCSAANAERWTFRLEDSDRGIELDAGVSGTIDVMREGAGYRIRGTMQYEGGECLGLYYDGPVTDLAVFDASEHNGTGSMKWSFEDEPRAVSATCYKYLQFPEGDMYLIFLYCGGGNRIPVEEWGLDDEYNSVHSVYNYEGVLIFVPASFVAEGKEIDLTETADFDSFTERRLPWAVTGMFGNMEFADGTYFSTMFYAYEDKVKLGAATLGYNLIEGATMKVSRDGAVWDIELSNIARDTDEGRDKVLSGHYHGTMESWTEYAKTTPWLWLDQWLLFDANQ